MIHFLKKIFGEKTEKSLDNQLPFNIPVLCYHSWTLNGRDYGTNDHVSLEKDLRALSEQGYEIISPTGLVNLIEDSTAFQGAKGKRLVCLTFDDGRDYDYYDHVDDQWGEVKSFHRILLESRTYIPQFDSGPRGVSFVIASPEARRILDKECGRGRDEWQDSWWADCAEEGILGIANHSWDHVHDALPEVRQKDNRKGSFYEISTFPDAEAQIAEAQVYVDKMTDGNALPVFGYPYGEASDYLVNEYFPNNGKRLGLRGAFSTERGYATSNTNVWNIPRFVCGDHWKTQDEFLELLKASESKMPNLKTKASSSECDLEDITLDECFLVIEVDEAEAIVGDLFKRRFHTDSFPDTPCHYVAFVRYRDGTLRPVGYVHYTLIGEVALCGGLVIDNRQFRLLPEAVRQCLHQAGGIAELLLRETFARLPESVSTIWGHVGDLQSEKVCLRVGFQHTREKYLLVVWRKPSIPIEEQERLIDHVSEMTPF